jgi:Protein of unknown function (DUF3684)
VRLVLCTNNLALFYAVKQQATVDDLFEALLTSPQHILNKLGSEQKYKALLRRIAANPPFRSVSSRIKQAPFLLAYSLGGPSSSEKKEDTEPSITYKLRKGEDIYIIDVSLQLLDILYSSCSLLTGSARTPFSAECFPWTGRHTNRTWRTST